MGALGPSILGLKPTFYVLDVSCSFPKSDQRLRAHLTAQVTQIIRDGTKLSLSRRNLMQSFLSRFVDAAQTLLFSGFDLTSFYEFRASWGRMRSNYASGKVWFSVYISSSF